MLYVGGKLGKFFGHDGIVYHSFEGRVVQQGEAHVLHPLGYGDLFLGHLAGIFLPIVIDVPLVENIVFVGGGFRYLCGDGCRARCVRLFFCLLVADGDAQSAFVYDGDFLLFRFLRVQHGCHVCGSGLCAGWCFRRACGLRLGRRLRCLCLWLRGRGGRLCRRLGLGGSCWGGDGFQGRLRRLSSLHRGVPGGELCQLYQRQFHQQALVAAEAVVQIAVVTQLNGLIQERQGALLGLLAVALPDAGPYFQQGQGGGICADQQVAEMGCQSGDEMVAVEALVQYLVE